MNGKQLILIELTVILGCLCVSSVTGLTCLSCQNVVNINDCFKQISCQDSSEECFLDWTLLHDTTTAVFTAGCRAKQVCNLLSGAVGKRDAKRSSIGCAQCCNNPLNGTGIPCNGYLCKQAPYPRRTCGVCDRVSDPKDCHVDQVCQPHEACKVNTLFTNGRILYELGCELKSVCDKLLIEYQKTHHYTTPYPGKRGRQAGDFVLCSACCAGVGCNKAECSTVIHSQKCFTSRFCV